MESKDRLYTDRENKMFIPMSIDSSEYREKWLTTPKIVTILGSIAILVLVPIYLCSNYAKWYNVVLTELVILFIDSFLIRYIVFDEKMYYKMYVEIQKRKDQTSKNGEVISPAELWAIPSIDDTASGAVLNYRDGTLGVVVKLVRGAIVGRDRDFVAYHYTCLSEATKNLLTKGYSWSYLNNMETSEDDVRVPNMNKLLGKSDNEKINNLVSMQIGYLIRIANNTYSEVEYMVIRTNKLNRKDVMIEEVTEALEVLTDGGYEGIEVLKLKEVNNLFKKYNNISYFNPTEVYSTNNTEYNSIVPFSIKKIVWEDNNIQTLNSKDKDKIKVYVSKLESGETVSKSLKDLVYRNEVGVRITGTSGEEFIDPESFGEDEEIDI